MAINAVAMWRVKRLRRSAWWFVLVTLLVLLVAGALLWPRYHGYVAGAAWLMLVMVPLLLVRLQGWLIGTGRLRLAWLVAHLARLLHPADGWWQLPRLVRAMDLISRGQRDAAAKVLNHLDESHTPIGWAAKIHLFRLDHQWTNLREWVEQEAAPRGGLGEFTVAFNYLRALGELGDYPALIRSWAQLVESPSELASQPTHRQSLRMLVLAYCGRVAALERLLNSPGAPSDPNVRAIWHATALQAANRLAEAEVRLLKLLASADPLTRVSAARRLSHPVPLVPDELLSIEDKQLLARAENPPLEERPHNSLHHPPAGVPVLTYTLLLMNLTIFLWLEFWLPLDWFSEGFGWAGVLWEGGGSQSEARLRSFGALIIPVDDWATRWPRVVTANFLHVGWLHLMMNSFGLWFFGRYLERLLGSVQFLLGYLACGLGAMLAVCLLMPLWTPDDGLVVGASGCVMGLVGLTAVVSLRLWRHHRSDTARQQVLMIGLLVVLQSLYDWFTPQISGTAHLAGLLLGVLLGSLFVVNFEADEDPHD